MAIEFARQGADVAVSGRRADKLAEVVREVERLGRRGMAVPCDVSDDAAVASAVDTVVATLGRLDVAVANAGRGVVGKVEELSDELWRAQFDVNFFGAMNVARRALPELRKTRGRMVFVGSISSLVALPKNAAYTASKFALRAASLTLSQELAGTGVTSTILHPGFVESEIVKVDNAGAFHDNYKDRRPARLIWPTDKAARVMVRAVAARRREFVFTGHGKIGAFLGQHMPGVVQLVSRRLSV